MRLGCHASAFWEGMYLGCHAAAASCAGARHPGGPGRARSAPPQHCRLLCQRRLRSNPAPAAPPAPAWTTSANKIALFYIPYIDIYKTIYLHTLILQPRKSPD